MLSRRLNQHFIILGPLIVKVVDNNVMDKKITDNKVADNKDNKKRITRVADIKESENRKIFVDQQTSHLSAEDVNLSPRGMFLFF